MSDKEFWASEGRVLAMRQWVTQEVIDDDFVPDEYLELFRAAYYEEIDRLYQIGPELLDAVA